MLMRNPAFGAYLACALLQILLWANPCFASVTPVSPPADQGIKCTSDGKSYLDKLYNTANGFDDYEFDSELVMYQKKPGDTSRGKFYYKRMDLVRLENLTDGVEKGAVVVHQPDGRIRASGGSGLRFLKMTLAPDSHLLLLPSGYNLIESDFGSLLNTLVKDVASGAVPKMTAEPVPVKRFSKNVYVLEVTKSGALTDRLFVDPSTTVPEEWDVFKGGSLFSITTFDNFKANIGLKDAFFKL